MIQFQRDTGWSRRFPLLTMTMVAFFALSKASQHWSECVDGDEDPALMARLMLAEVEFDEISKGIDKLTTVCRLKKEKELQEKRLSETKADLDSTKEELQILTNEVNMLRKEIGENFTSMDYKPKDCADLRILGSTTTGEYTIFPTEEIETRVLCDMDTEHGGWTVFLKLHDAFIGQTENFLNKNGRREGDSVYWIGTDVLHYLSKYNSTVKPETDDDGKENCDWTSFSSSLKSTRPDRNHTWQGLSTCITNVFNSNKVSLTMKIRRHNYERITLIDDEVISDER